MKKIKLQINKQYRLPDANVSHEIRLKKIYDNSLNHNRDKSPRNSIKKDTNNRYGVLTDRKIQDTRQSKYEAYLQSQYIKPKNRPNRRYQRKIQSDKEKQRQSADFTAYMADPIHKKRPNGQSVDMFKIRKTRQKLSDRKMSVSHSKINNQPISTFEQAKQLYKKSKFKEALTLFNSCIQSKPDRPDYQYYTAICHLNLHDYSEGFKILQKICYVMPNFKKSAFLFAAISAKNLQKYQQAFKLCTQGLALYPTYNDLIAYRAKLSELKQDYQSAHKDYQSILKTDKNNVQILMNDAECLYKTKSFANCLSNLAAALYADKGEMKEQILNRRIQVNLQLDNIKEVKKDLLRLEQISGQERQCSKILFIKGLILSKQGKKKQSILCYEESLKAATSKQAMAKSLVEITKCKINDRDFYSAFYHISRSKTLQLESPEIQIYKLFSEGVVYLMKRKIKEGNDNLQKIITKYPNLTNYLKKIYYLYRAFAKFSLSSYEKAISDYEQANKEDPIDIYAKYNKLLAEGILMIQQQKYDESIKYFNQAQKILSFTTLHRIEAYLYRAAAYIDKAKGFMKIQHEMQQLKSLQEIFTALKELDKAFDINDSNSNMLYLRGLIYLYLGKFDEALQDILKAISKSEENVAKYFFFRGLTHSSLGNSKQALNDYSICTNLDENFYLVYLQRAKINFENENVTKALQDLMKLKSIRPNQDIKYHEACLNFMYGHYVMAHVCCEQIKDPEKAKRMKILIKTKLGKIKQVKKLVNSSGDRMICDIMLGKVDSEEVSSNQLEYFSLFHYHHYLGIRQFKKQNYEEAIDMFGMAIKERNLLDLEQGIANPSLSEIIDHDENEIENLESEKEIVNKINYNIFLCHLLNKEYRKAYEVFIRDIISVKNSLLKNQFIAAFSNALFQSISCQTEPEQKQIYELTLFESKIDRLSESLLIELPTLFIKSRICYLSIYDHKLAKQYSPKADPDFIINYLNLAEIQNKPEPPWVKREDSGLIFTDEVTNINIEFMTTENDEQDEQEEQEQNSDEDDEEQREDESNVDNDNNISVGKFKEKMKLGDSLQRKLQMIMDRKKKKQIALVESQESDE